MQIKYEVPPLWEKIREKFSLAENNPIFYTHGDVIYSPAKIAPSDDLLAHEFCHAEQQDHSDDVANIWWQQYLHDPDFRISQESEAYGAQYRFICEKYKNREVRAKYLHHFAIALSGKTYGNCISHSEAIKMIREMSEHGRPKLSTV